MRRIILLFITILIPFIAQAQGDHYTIKGTGETLMDGDTIYLCSIKGLFYIQKHDSTIVKNGEYIFTGSYPGCEIRYVIPLKNGKYAGITSIMLENSDITVHSFHPDSKKEAEVTGGQNFKLWREYKAIQQKWSKEMLPHRLIIRDSISTKKAKQYAQHVIDSLTILQKNDEYHFMIDNLPAPFCDLILGNEYKSFSPKQRRTAMASFKKKYPESINYNRLLPEMKANASIEVGKKFIDFSMSDPKGRNISIGEIVKKNKYTLVDFWASWCGPCRAEMPHVAEAYNTFHDKGFEVVGVSLEMPWPQMSDLKAWQSEGAKLYNVKAIPSNVLINNKGVIVARDLRGLTLINKIEELLR